MRVVIQRVLNANASVNGEVVSSIGKGLCILIGIAREDTRSDIEFIVKKVLNLKLFENSDGKRWATSVKESGGEILCLSQFTLHALIKGNKLDFHRAKEPDEGKQLFNEFLEHIKSEYKPEFIKEGVFGAYSVIGIQNDGPVTITIDSLNRGYSTNSKTEKLCARTSKSKQLQKTDVDKIESTLSQASLIGHESASSQTTNTIEL